MPVFSRTVLLIGFLALIAIGLFLVSLLFSKRPPPPSPSPSPLPTTPIFTPPPTPQPIYFQGIIPGRYREDDVVRMLGEPIKREQEGGKDILFYPNTLFYPTKSEYLFNRVFLDDTVRYIIQEMNTLADSPYPKLIALSPDGPDGILYEPDENLFWWHVFARHGAAVFANEDGEALTAMYFPPMSFEEFRRTIAKDFNLADEPPTSGF